jgi:drug/metabolite transporter (DMT)-like permease
MRRAAGTTEDRGVRTRHSSYWNVSRETFLLVALSALTHAYWNFLLKRCGGSQMAVALSKVVEAGLFLPLLLFGLAPGADRLLDSWLLPVVGAALVLLNYVLLAAAYKRGELSVIYPVVRGGMLVFLPPLAYVTLGERLTPAGWIAIIAIVLGIVVLQAWQSDLRQRWLTSANALSLAAGFVAAGYTIWDKKAVQSMSPVTYFGAYTVLLGIAYVPFLRPKSSAELWRFQWRSIVQIGLFNSGSYLLTLLALQSGAASHVIAVRQLSIAIGALLGWRWLGESMSAPRIVGVVLVVFGCVLMGLTK